MSLAQSSIAEVLGRLSGADRSAGGLSAAAMSCAFATCLVERASADGESPFAVARSARSSALSERLLMLAERSGLSDAPSPEDEDDDPPGAADGQVVSTALAIASCAAQVTSLAAECAAGGSDAVVGDAITAAEVADGACRAAAHIIRISLRDSPGDPRRTEATGLVTASSESLQDAFAEAAERERPA